MNQRILSVLLALCLCLFPQSAAQASTAETLPQENIFLEESKDEPSLQDDSTIPAPTEVYAAMTALKNQDMYKEGATWTNDEPYSDPGYRWKGGPLNGTNIVAVGCVAFAFTLSDAAFGSLPARMYGPGEFPFEDIKVGDILRVNNDAHTVIVLEVNAAGVVVAEGNYSGKVHWGRAISKEEVEINTSHYITRYPEGYVPPDNPEANDSIDKGTLSGGLAWNLTKAGTLTISGKGAMPDYGSAGEQPWNKYNDQIRMVIIENGVTSIGSYTFAKCGTLSVRIADSMTTIGNSAFSGSSIISVDVPSSVKTIGDSAFHECQNLSSVTFSEGLETIGQSAFRGCTSLTSIDLPASIGEVGGSAFMECTVMTSAVFAPGSKQVKLGDNMFTRCYALVSVTLPSSIDRIGEGMFQICWSLAGVEIPQGAESIGGSAFASSVVETLIIPDSVRTIGTAAFSACPLADIYFTGMEAQWKSISKQGDTATAVSKMTIHYNYIPREPEENEPGENKPGENEPEENKPGESESEENKPGDNQPGENNPGNSRPDAGQPGENQPGNSNTGQVTRPDTGIPFIKGEDGKFGWDVIRADEENAGEGSVVNVNMNGASVVPGDIFDSIKGRNITITFDMGNGILWSVNGKSITTEQAGDIDFSVRIGTNAIPEHLIRNVTGEGYRIQLSLSHEGQFGFTAVLSINLGKENAGRTAVLYYYNQNTKALELICKERMAEDGTARLTFTHASDYLLVMDDSSDSGNESITSGAQVTAPKSGDRENGSLWWILMAGALAALIALHFQKKRETGYGKNSWYRKAGF